MCNFTFNFIGGPVINNKPKANQYLIEEQAEISTKKPELGGIINTETLHQEIDQERQLNRIDDTSRAINPYKRINS